MSVTFKGVLRDTKGLSEHPWTRGADFPDLIAIIRVDVAGDDLKRMAGNLLSPIPLVRGESCTWGQPWADWIWQNRYGLFGVEQPKPLAPSDGSGEDDA